MKHLKRAVFAVALIAGSFAAVLVAASSQAQTSSSDATVKEIEKYRQALGDGNPAELWEARGEGIWKK